MSQKKCPKNIDRHIKQHGTKCSLRGVNRKALGFKDIAKGLDGGPTVQVLFRDLEKLKDAM